ncbi:polysaccharide lyase family 8 protein [Sphaerobolus stellatus SS14]|uniref:Polysaccharide lyase family 8 protein n=1 Tax=Sphaerobolus stellatus (strain SS14) TaxID=990650 RepID=A0A0C9VZI8_SPHS4|nr:polysaccharide lyase family 8 protein [Sphaerobolus stellatus SS14]
MARKSAPLIRGLARLALLQGIFAILVTASPSVESGTDIEQGVLQPHISSVDPSCTLPAAPATSGDASNARRNVPRDASSPEPASPNPKNPNSKVVASPSKSDIDTLLSRRLVFLVQQQTSASSIAKWTSTLKSDGTWPDVDYTSGCDAQRANWPAEDHWFRLGTLAAAWHGGFGTSSGFVKNATLLAQIGSAMDWWFARDFTVPSCLDTGGTGSCPCGTPGLWNTNWFSNVIGVSRPVSQVCLLLSTSNLSSTQQSNCSNIPLRSYSVFHRATKPSFLAGANTLDIASIGISGGLLTNNASGIQEAYGFVHNEVQVQVGFEKDGILPDGSFAQHAGILYNGNYGKDYTNDVLELEIEAAGTSFASADSSRAAFETLMNGSAWMIYENTKTKTLHWDFSAEGRFISFPVVDNQATASININISEIQQLGSLLPSTALQQVGSDLTDNTGSANVGGLTGNRMFWNSDYMVHRGKNYVTTLKMYSSRTHNAECTNAENPFGFHQSDGVLYTYQNGDEYEDIAAAMDWNMFPGITVDYNGTPLTCNTTNAQGIESFVGGASTGQVGAAVMRYTNPLTHSLSFQKAWFFLPNDIQHVAVSITNTSSTAPIFSILDQRKLNGDVFVNNTKQATPSGNYTHAQSLFHDSIGYVFPKLPVSVSAGSRTGKWSSLGISTQPDETVDLFAAWVDHNVTNNDTLSYSIYPSRSSASAFASEASNSPIQTIQEDRSIHAVVDTQNAIAMVVFWGSTGGSVSIPATKVSGLENSISITSNNALVLIVDEKNGSFAVSDPTQTLKTAQLTFNISGGAGSKVVSVQFPTGGQAGSSVILPYAKALASAQGGSRTSSASRLSLSPLSPYLILLAIPAVALFSAIDAFPV